MTPDEPLPRLSSPVCLLGEMDDPQQALDVARWRKAERERLLAERAALSVAERQAVGAAIGEHLDALLARRFGKLSGRVVSGYWPIKSEPDLRPWMTALKGARLALPVVVVRKAPLVFRPWAPGAAMVRGDWNIPVPATEEVVTPDIALAPLVGWDAEGFRLGYGGGYFDRTLAVRRPFVIGVGLQAGRLATIFPQGHDIGLDAIVTEAGIQVELV